MIRFVHHSLAFLLMLYSLIAFGALMALGIATAASGPVVLALSALTLLSLSNMIIFFKRHWWWGFSFWCTGILLWILAACLHAWPGVLLSLFPGLSLLQTSMLWLIILLTPVCWRLLQESSHLWNASTDQHFISRSLSLLSLLHLCYVLFFLGYGLFGIAVLIASPHTLALTWSCLAAFCSGGAPVFMALFSQIRVDKMRLNALFKPWGIDLGTPGQGSLFLYRYMKFSAFCCLYLCSFMGPVFGILALSYASGVTSTSALVFLVLISTLAILQSVFSFSFVLRFFIKTFKPSLCSDPRMSQNKVFLVFMALFCGPRMAFPEYTEPLIQPYWSPDEDGAFRQALSAAQSCDNFSAKVYRDDNLETLKVHIKSPKAASLKNTFQEFLLSNNLSLSFEDSEATATECIFNIKGEQKNISYIYEGIRKLPGMNQGYLQDPSQCLVM